MAVQSQDQQLSKSTTLPIEKCSYQTSSKSGAEQLVFRIVGRPIAQMRHRTHNKIAYDPLKQTKMAIRCILSSQVKGPPLKGPLFLQCNCYFEIPNSWSKKRRQNAIEGKELHQSKPDIDNLLKFYADCLTDIAYDDDRQIVSVNTNKYYAEESYTLLIVTSLDGSPDAPKSIIGQ